MIPNSILIFTDGAARCNPGPGGWGAVLVLPKQNEKNYELGSLKYEVTEIGGRETLTTNNRMELLAVIKALCIIHNSRFIIHIYSDSSYLINGITKWVHGWQKKGWKTSAKEDVLNRDLWERLIKLTEGKKIEWKLVKGHFGVAGNERCDEIAQMFADTTQTNADKIKLYRGPLSGYHLKDILKYPTLPKAEGKHWYISLVDGKIERHKTWTECERRVKKIRGAKYKKVRSAGEETRWLDSWITG